MKSSTSSMDLLIFLLLVASFGEVDIILALSTTYYLKEKIGAYMYHINEFNVWLIMGTLLFSPSKENLIESNLLSCIINKRIVIAAPIAAGIGVLAYIFSFYVGAYAAFPAIVAFA